jgi:peptidoglycan/xylan/chitin deacetylase (PgdA/CDA1 family)
VSDETPLFVKDLYSPRAISQFKTDLEVFLKYYQPISLEEVILHNSGKKLLSKPSFHLTFDDGLANFYEVIAPILKEKNIPATVFLNTAFVDNKNLFYRYKEVLFGEERKEKRETIQHFLEKEKPYLTLKQIKELQKQGFTFGSHSVNHPLYQKLTLDEQILETKESLQWIATNLQEKYHVFSFPFHDIGITKNFFDAIKDNVEITFGTSGFKKDEISTNLHRLDMEKAIGNTKAFLKKEYIKLFIKKVANKYLIKRQ